MSLINAQLNQQLMNLPMEDETLMTTPGTFSDVTKQIFTEEFSNTTNEFLNVAMEANQFRYLHQAGFGKKLTNNLSKATANDMLSSMNQFSSLIDGADRPANGLFSVFTKNIISPLNYTNDIQPSANFWNPKAMKSGFNRWLFMTSMFSNPEDVTVQSALMGIGSNVLMSALIPTIANRYKTSEHLGSIRGIRSLKQSLSHRVTNIVNATDSKRSGLVKQLFSKKATWGTERTLYSHLRKSNIDYDELLDTIQTQIDKGINERTIVRGTVADLTKDIAPQTIKDIIAKERNITTNAYITGQKAADKALNKLRSVSLINNSTTTKNFMERAAKRAIQFGGGAIQLGNIAQLGISVGYIANSYIKAKQRVSQEYFSRVATSDFAFATLPNTSIASTERQRAIQAIQNSGLNLRNYLGNEASLSHR